MQKKKKSYDWKGNEVAACVRFPFHNDNTTRLTLRSSGIVCDHDRRIAEVCFHMIADDRRTFCDLRSAIVCDHMETSLKWRQESCCTTSRHPTGNSSTSYSMQAFDNCIGFMTDSLVFRRTSMKLKACFLEVFRENTQVREKVNESIS